jgi:hypothetical protein
MEKFKFNLERALKGARVITRNESQVTIGAVNEDANEHHKLAGWVTGINIGWSLDGVFEREKESPLDLFMADKHISEKYVNVHRDAVGEWVDDVIYDTYDDAYDCGVRVGCGTYHQTIKICYTP